MKHVYLALLVILAGACMGNGDKQSEISKNSGMLLASADSFTIDSIVHECRAVRWNHAECDEEGELEWDDWRPKDCDVLLSQNILVADHPEQMYYAYEKSPWAHTDEGTYSCILHAVDHDGIDCSIILKVAEGYNVLMYVLFDEEAFCYEMEMLPDEDDIECYD